MGLYKKFKKNLKIIDIFGQPINFRYKGDKKFKTRTGACCTILMITLTFITCLGPITNLIVRTKIYFEKKTEF